MMHLKDRKVAELRAVFKRAWPNLLEEDAIYLFLVLSRKAEIEERNACAKVAEKYLATGATEGIADYVIKERLREEA